MHTRHLLSFALASLALAACPPPMVPIDTGGDDGGGTGGTDSGKAETILWDDIRLETSEAIYGGYASGAGFYVVTSTGQSWVRQTGTWTRVDIDVDEEDLNGLWGVGGGESLRLHAVGDGGFMAEWTGGGWTVTDTGTANFESISGPSTTDLLAVGWGGVYANRTGSWSYEAVDGSPRFNSVWYDGTVAVAVGEDGIIGTWSDKTGWNVITSTPRETLYGVSGSGPDDIWAVGAAGTTLHFDGTEWTEQASGTTLPLWDVDVGSNGEVYAVGNGGIALAWTGKAWEISPTGVDNNLYDVDISPIGDVWAVGNRGMTLRTNPNL